SPYLCSSTRHPPPTSPLSPYTTLFRSIPPIEAARPPPKFSPAAEPDAEVPPNTGKCRTTFHETPRRRRNRPRKSGKVRPDSSLRSEEHTSELQSRENLVCRLLLEKKKY